MSRYRFLSRMLICAFVCFSVVCVLPPPVPASSLSIFKKSRCCQKPRCCVEQPKCKPLSKPEYLKEHKCSKPSPACKNTEAGEAIITVYCPHHTIITINGGKTHQTGNYRQYRSLLPDDGKCRRYNVVASITENNKSYTLRKTTILCANEGKSIDFHKLLVDKKREASSLQALQAIERQIQAERKKAEQAAQDAKETLAAVQDMLKVKFKFQETSLVAYVKYAPLDGSIANFNFERPSTPKKLTVLDETKWAPGGAPPNATLTFSVEAKTKDKKSFNLGAVTVTNMMMVTSVKKANISFVNAAGTRVNKATFFFDGVHANDLRQHVVNLIKSKVSESQQMSDFVISAEITTPDGTKKLINTINVDVRTRK